MNRKFIFIILLSTISILLILYWLSYVNNNQNIVTLTPEEGDIKIKPKSLGGIFIPYKDSSVYNQLYPQKKEYKIRILSEPEDPIDLLGNKKIHHSVFVDSIDKILDNIEYYEKVLLNSDYQDNNDSNYIIPNTIQKQNDIDIDNEMNISEEDKVVIPISGTSLKVIKSEENRYDGMKNNLFSDNNGYKIQLSSAYSLPDAQKQWNKIQNQHYQILQNTTPIIQKIEGKNERIFYIIMTGIYSSLNQAKKVCKKLLLQKQNCIVIK